MAERIGTGLLSRGYAGSTPAGDARSECLVMRLASQLHCLWSETGSIPVRGAGNRMQSHGDQGASKTPREGSIPSHPANWGRSEVSSCTCNAGLGVRLPAAPPTPGAIVQQENPAIAMRRSGCDSPSLHHLAVSQRRTRRGAIAQSGERLDGIEEVAGATPAGSTAHEPRMLARTTRNYNGPKVAIVGRPT